MRENDLRAGLPSSEPAALPPRPRRRQQMKGSHLLIIGVVAFVFGVALHVYVVQSVLSGGSKNDNGVSGSQQTIVVSTATPQASATAQPGATATVSPTGDRTSCEAIRGTSYRSEKERQFFLANCLTPTP